ncbi:MAG: RnfABCDGE type electron transport complex subunit D [Gammaproteobacteria bacterium]|nr:RnfABCDGE type electron transport complex subunit D [Gammaproteobacteria bacterium]
MISKYKNKLNSQKIMYAVCLAALPGCLTTIWFFGYGVIINLFSAILFAMLFEALILRVRNKSITATLKDGSAAVTGVLLGLSLPPLIPVWMVCVACFFAIVFAKQLYGGVGQNLFNPAMVGYVILLISFPLAMSTWPAPRGLVESPMEFVALLGIKLSMVNMPDGFTMATPLDIVRHRQGLTINEVWQTANGFGSVSGKGWEWINFAYLAGGSFLVFLGICRWQVIAAMLATLGVLAAAFYDGGSSLSTGSPMMHWFGGATMLCAFFIMTDPVTAPDTTRGLIIFGVGTGMLIFIIRVWGAYPEGVAFAILLMNMTTPLLNRLTQPEAANPKDQANL